MIEKQLHCVRRDAGKTGQGTVGRSTVLFFYVFHTVIK